MASFLLLPHPHSLLLKTEIVKLERPFTKIFRNSQFSVVSPRASVNGDSSDGAIESPKPSRRGRKKKPASESTASPTKRTRRRKKNQVENGSIEAASGEETSKGVRKMKSRVPVGEEEDEDPGDYDDGIDFPYEDPPLVCCFGAVQKEFVPTVRVHDNPMHPDIYSEWKMLQWDPPEFGRAPGGSPSNVAISHVRLGGRAAFMGKVGEDDLGSELVLMMNKEKVQTRAVKFDGNFKTACAYMKVKFEDGKMKMETVKEAAENSLVSSELNLPVLKEVNFTFSFTNLSLDMLATGSLFRMGLGKDENENFLSSNLNAG